MQQAMQQWSVKNGNQGQWGRAAGGQSQYAKTPTRTKLEQSKVQTVEGDVIAKQLFDGQQVRGESKAKASAVAEAVRKGVDEAQTEDNLPRIYQEAQQHYFGELEKLTKATEEKAAEGNKPADPAKPDDAPADNEPAKDDGNS